MKSMQSTAGQPSVEDLEEIRTLDAQMKAWQDRAQLFFMQGEPLQEEAAAHALVVTKLAGRAKVPHGVAINEMFVVHCRDAHQQPCSSAGALRAATPVSPGPGRVWAMLLMNALWSFGYKQAGLVIYIGEANCMHAGASQPSQPVACFMSQACRLQAELFTSMRQCKGNSDEPHISSFGAEVCTLIMSACHKTLVHGCGMRSEPDRLPVLSRLHAKHSTPVQPDAQGLACVL